jgi:hypothetical protein
MYSNKKENHSNETVCGYGGAGPAQEQNQPWPDKNSLVSSPHSAKKPWKIRTETSEKSQ